MFKTKAKLLNMTAIQDFAPATFFTTFALDLYSLCLPILKQS